MLCYLLTYTKHLHSTVTPNYPLHSTVTQNYPLHSTVTQLSSALDCNIKLSSALDCHTKLSLHSTVTSNYPRTWLSHQTILCTRLSHRVATNLENLEFSGNLKSLREFRENSGNFNVTQGILWEWEIYVLFAAFLVFSNLRASRLGFLCIFFGNETLSKLCECLFLDFHFSSDLNEWKVVDIKSVYLEEKRPYLKK